MMTLSEAIEHAEWCAENSCGECADDHRQLAEWLKELVTLRVENAKLQELADVVKEFVEDTNCEDCPFRRDCNDNNRIFCVNDFSYRAFAAMRKLGIEVELCEAFSG